MWAVGKENYNESDPAAHLGPSRSVLTSQMRTWKAQFHRGSLVFAAPTTLEVMWTQELYNGSIVILVRPGIGGV